MPFQLDQIDSRVPLADSGGSSSNELGSGGVFNTLAQMNQVQAAQAQAQDRQTKAEEDARAAADDAAIRQTLPRFDRPDEAINDLLVNQGRATAAAKLGNQVATMRKTQAQAYSDQADATRKKLDQVGGMLQAVTNSGQDNALYQNLRPQMVKLASDIYGQTANDIFPTTYDDTRLKALLAGATTRTEQLKAETDTSSAMANLYKEGAISNPGGAAVPHTGQLPPGVQPGPAWAEPALKSDDWWLQKAGPLLKTADTAVKYNGYINGLYQQGMPKTAIAVIPPWNDANPQATRDAAANLGVSAKDVADIANQKQERSQEDTRLGIEQQQANTAAGKASGAGEAKPPTQAQVATWKAARDVADKSAFAAYNKETAAATANAAMMPGLKGPQLQAAQQQMNLARASANDKFIQAKIQNENDYRDKQNMPPLDVAAQAAVNNGDQGAYNIVRQKYDALAGQGALAKVVPWAPPAAGGAAPGPAVSAPPASRPGGRSAAPAGAAMDPVQRRQQVAALIAESQTATPQRQAEIAAQLLQLR